MKKKYELISWIGFISLCLIIMNIIYFIWFGFSILALKLIATEFIIFFIACFLHEYNEDRNKKD